MFRFSPDRIEDLFIKLKPILGEKKTNKLWILYHTSITQRKFIESLLYIWAAKYLDETYERKEILLSPVPNDKSEGDYPIGMVFYRDRPEHPFALKEDEMIQHIAIFGRSGSGKTTVAFIILWNLLIRGKPFLVLDWKRDYRSLLAIHDDILVFTIGRGTSPFCWNPLIPPEGVLPTTWIRKLVEILCNSYYLGEGVSYLLTKSIDSVFREHGVYDNADTYPTLTDVFNYINSYKATGREGQWLDSTKRTLAVLCFGEFGKSLNSGRSMPTGMLLNQNVIMELDSLTNSDKTFFTEALLLWIHNYRLCQGEREKFRHAILIEEAHHILLRKKQELQGEETITDVILREIRELCEAVILIDQHPSLISKPALGNTYTTICMNLKHSSDVVSVADSILLNPDQRDYLGELPIGSAIVKLQGRWFKPFLVKFPYMPVKKGIVTDEAIKSKMIGYLSYLSQSKPDGDNPEVIRVILGYERKGKKELLEGLGREELSLLQDTLEYPVSGIVERYRRIGINSFQGNVIKKQLLQKGLARESEINTKKGRIKILQPASEVLRLFEHENKKGLIKPSIEHEYWKKRVSEQFRNSGYEVTEEANIGKIRVDLIARNQNESVAVEIETGKSDAVFNIKKDVEAGFDKVISVALNKKVKEKIIEELDKIDLSDRDKIEVMDIEELL